MAGHRRSDLHEATFERQGLIPLAHVLDQVTHESCAVDLAEKRRRFAQGDGPRPERLDHDAVACKLIGTVDEAFHVRLVESRCGNHLMDYQKRLEALDGVLGEYHNVILLRDVLITDGYLSRRESVVCLRVVSRYQRYLRRHAEALAVRIYSDKPGRYVRRVERLWRAEAAVPDKDRPRPAP